MGEVTQKCIVRARFIIERRSERCDNKIFKPGDSECGNILGDCDNKGFEWTAVFPRSGYSGHEHDNPTLADPRLVHPPHHFTQTNSRPRVNDILRYTTQSKVGGIRKHYSWKPCMKDGDILHNSSCLLSPFASVYPSAHLSGWSRPPLLIRRSPARDPRPAPTHGCVLPLSLSSRYRNLVPSQICQRTEPRWMLLIRVNVNNMLRHSINSESKKWFLNL